MVCICLKTLISLFWNLKVISSVQITLTKSNSSKYFLIEKMCFFILYPYRSCLTQCQAKRLPEDFSSSVSNCCSLWFCLPNVVSQDFAIVIIFNRTQVSFFIAY